MVRIAPGTLLTLLFVWLSRVDLDGRDASETATEDTGVVPLDRRLPETELDTYVHEPTSIDWRTNSTISQTW
ncbi:hypothetical protein BRC76_01255 [Halobacteriales archaeon QH_8_67_36]|nr:MAG: hypothetical protein BRC76_01255 [Halobacteriales archaeon QH_8_67_36]